MRQRAAPSKGSDGGLGAKAFGLGYGLADPGHG